MRPEELSEQAENDGFTNVTVFGLRAGGGP